MHDIRFPEGLIERQRQQRGGRLHFLDRIDPSRTAHVVIDMQNGFLEPGTPAEVPVAREIVPNINAISAAMRAAGGCNVIVQYTTPKDASPEWSNFYRRLGPEVADIHRRTFATHSHGWQLWPALDVKTPDLTIVKGRFSSFTPGTCGLHELLTSRGIDTLLVTGTVSNICCESTARDAMQLNYEVVFVSDGTAAFSDDDHNAALRNMMALFADVMTTQEVLGRIRR